MKKEEVVIDINELKIWKQKNFQERIWFIKYLAKHILNKPLKIWSKGQADFINAQIRGSHSFYNRLDDVKRAEMINHLKERLKR